MANIIKIKRGLSSNISNATLEQGELAITTDTQDLYVGTDSGNKKVGGVPKNILDGNAIGSARTIGAKDSEGQSLGKYAWAEGKGTIASGDKSHAEGDNTNASGHFQHVQGKYNIEDTTNAHIVGNGSISVRSNAHTLDWNGNAWFAGDVYTGSTSGTNKDEGSKILATKEYVDSKTSANYTYDKVVYVLPPSEVTTTTGKTAFTQDSEARTFTAIGAITGEDPVAYENVITLTADVKNILIYSVGSLIGDVGPADQIAQISITDASGTTSQILNTRGCSENLINTGPLTSGSKLTLTYTSGTYEPSNAQQVFTLEYYTNTVTDASLQDFISSKVTHESTDRRQMDMILQKNIDAQYTDLQTQIFDLQGHVIENMLDAVTFRLSNLDNKSEFRFFGPSDSGVTHLGLSFEDVSLTSGDKFEMSATFQTASSGCTFEITESTSVKVKLTGDDVTNGVLSPVANKVYEIAFYWNGLFMSGVVKEIYKRRIMVGDILTSRTLYTDFPDDFINIVELDGIYVNRSIFVYNNSSAGTLDTCIHECLENPFGYSIYVGTNDYDKTIYFYTLKTNKLEVNKNEYKMSDTVQDVTEVTDCQAYRHIYIKDPNIRPLKVGDALKNGTKLYFTIPDDISEQYTAYKYPPSALMPLAVEPDSDVTLTLIDKFLSITYYDSITDGSTRIVNIALSDGSSNTDIFKAQHFGQPSLNLSSYNVTNPETITDYKEFDFWSQFILVDETTL